ncbi:ornithine carbamoyltransferase [Jeotgalibaca ciconiae]|uniref:Ornithine carbamoyltransferase n=1 Tax=Jeotgalibaca ciconiae TaxID=2496265 RepID=A0A3Q9BJ72_9LACT|nr:ornithine carbamoyltransferase [Jeotgalibaca ciconiae]AZP03621.1 ornithine carbamoyltransferase [Jeotgalibaca ciconiae]HJB24187.1 ornithine carbamoyltransferase [Candidatus Jeotgalibaca pullicola]
MFQGKSFLKEIDFSSAQLEYLIDFAIHLKDLKKRGIPHEYLKGQNICLLFEKNSTRTRAAFTVATNDLGAAPEFLGANDVHLNAKESVEDTAKVLGSMFDGIEFRGFSQEVAEDLAKYAGVPVWNGLTDDWHPTQMIADYMTLKEEFGKLAGLKLVYCGDGRNNVANSLLVTGAILGVNVTVAAPESLFPEPALIDLAKGYAEKSGATIEVTEDVDAAVVDADALYTDVWVSMGEEDKFEERINLLKKYQINKELTDKIEKEYIFLHCLPAFHDATTSYAKEIAEKFGMAEMEVTDEVFRSQQARQFQQAENRMHSIKAIMAATNGNLFIPEIK